MFTKISSSLKRVLCFLPVCLMIFSCTHSVHMYAAGDIEKPISVTSMKQVSSDSEQFTVLGFIFDTNYVDEAVEKLRSQCEKGNIHFISSRYSTSHGFLSWKNKLHLEGYCIE
ncbi:MAG: hypothetical protein H7A23_04975 [Leptospiraceae bacterium]|nr:hypothetical protein [Leptospiraceae bacterium]MCP5493888.1 hypothetical protein [Leptospiraceae bacterium]